ncbi:MAG TPA: desulfoferrodoxin [Sedimenticola sp.]|nr:desulfoferrodoxin [Sedimenticola sp.]
MSDRRTFLKSTLVVAAGAAVARTAPALAGGGALPGGLIYTVENPGMWAKKVGGHAPKVSRDGDRVTITTRHSMSGKHYIVRHTLVAADGTVVGAKTFYPSDEEPVSSHQLPAGARGRFYATSFCNKHDFWVTEFEV